MYERLYQVRSDVPTVTHIAFLARSQTVSRTDNPRYWPLINAFKQRTGYGLLVNISFNVRGEPVVCTPKRRLPVLYADRNGLAGHGCFCL